MLHTVGVDWVVDRWLQTEREIGEHGVDDAEA